MTDLVAALTTLVARLNEPLHATKNSGNINPAASAALDQTLAKADEVGAVDTSDPTLATLAQVLELTGQFSAGLTELAHAAADGQGYDVAAEQLAEELLGLLIARYLDEHAPAALEVADLLTLAPVNGFGLRQLDLTRVPGLLRDPTGTFLTEYAGTGKPLTDLEAAAAGAVFLQRVQTLAGRLGIRAAPLAFDSSIPTPPGFPVRDALWIPLATDDAGQPLNEVAGLLLAVRSENDGGSGVALAAVGAAGLTFTGDRWVGSVRVAAADWVVLSTEGVNSPTAAADLRVALSARTAAPAPLFRTAATGTRLTIDQIGLSLVLDVATSGWDAKLELSLIGLRLIASPGDADGFLGGILGGDAAGGHNVIVGWDYRKGLYLGSGTSLSVSLPLPKLGPITPTGLDLSLSPTGEAVTQAATLGLSVLLGPVTFTVDRFGVTTKLTFPRTGGNLGPVHAEVDVVPPHTVGLALNAGAVTGGGFLTADPDQGLYAGGLQLKIGPVSVAAIALLTTKLPDGSRGWSLIVLISVRFPPVQLGFGFALTGIGGLLAVNRTVSLTALEASFVGGALDSLLFPADVVGNAARIVSDLQKYLPVARGQFVLGPTVEITWGVGGLLTAQLGVFVEFPSPVRVVLLGRVRIALPKPEAPVVDLRLDVLGSLDFATKRLALDAVLRNSRIGPFSLTGQAAVRVGWGGQPGFLCAIGGFNPHFNPPAFFPALPRITLSLTTSDNPRIRLSAYLALTSNTAQFGAHLDLYAGVDIPALGTFAVAVAVGFDALFQFDPIAFVVDLSASIALTWNRKPFLAVRLDLTLSGPRPWHAVGSATFSLFGTHRLRFEVTTGEQPTLEPAKVVDVVSLVRTALTDPGNWKAVPASDHSATVRLRDRGHDPGGLGCVVSPHGALQVSQTVAPLGLELTRFGQARLTAAVTVPVPSVGFGGVAVSRPLQDWFARAQFVELDDAAKLGQPSFDSLICGVEVAADGLAAPAVARWTHHDVTRQVVVLGGDTAPGPGLASALAPLSTERLLASIPSAAVAQAGPSASGQAVYDGPRQGTAVRPVAYAVATAFTLKSAEITESGAPQTYSSFTDADQARPLGGLDLLVVDANELFAPVAGSGGPVI